MLSGEARIDKQYSCTLLQYHRMQLPLVLVFRIIWIWPCKAHDCRLVVAQDADGKTRDSSPGFSHVG
jgi:hypothetical protein